MRVGKTVLAFTMLPVMATIAIFAILSAQSQRRACLNALRQINEPLNCCIPLERKLKAGDKIEPASLPDYFKGRILPQCPSGANFVFPYVAGARAICPKHGDLLATDPNVKCFGPKPIYAENPAATRP
jgi:hypothetical protein